jgi:E3 ubiquitin-protein ligase BRE1
MDIRTNEIRSLRLSNGKSSDIISQLKESEAQSRIMISNLEKQIVDIKSSNISTFAENKKMEAAITEANRRADSAKAQITELTNLVKSKDAALSTIRHQAMELETQVEKLKLRIEHISKERDNLKTKSMSKSSNEEDMLRVSLSVCAVIFGEPRLTWC